MDRFQEMQTFRAVVDAGSFVRAAEALGQSKAAVSRHVEALERRLGARLLQRTTRRLSLTEPGQVFYDRCRELLAALEDAEAEITSHGAAAIGLLRVNAPVTFGVHHLAPLWPAFLARHPKVELDVTLSDRLVDVVEEGYDLVVRIARLDDSSIVSRRIASMRLVLCASPRYVAEHGAPRHPSELAQHAVVGYSYFSSKDEWHFEDPQGRPVSVRTQPAVHTNSGDTGRAMALAHYGIVLQPSFLVAPDLASGALVELMPEYRAAQIGIHAVYPTRRHLSPKVRVLLEFLAESFRGRDADW